MPAAEPRYCVAQVTEEALEAWRAFCESNDINRNALAEVIGSWLAAAPDPVPPLVQRWIAETKALQIQRKRR